MPTKRSTSSPWYSALLEDLDRSGLTEEDVRKLHLTVHERGELKEIEPVGAGYRIPYFTKDGRPRADLYRYRFLEDTRKGFRKLASTKLRRYTQPAGTPPGVYWAPYIKWLEILAEPNIPLLVTEGEKKAAIATKSGMPCLGLGGVWSFRSAKRGVVLLPELEEVRWEGRLVAIVYDSDAAQNSDVCRAELSLADTLVGKGAKVKIVRLPELVENEKCALDDYLVNEGPERLAQLVEGTEEFEQGRELHKMNSEVIYVQSPGIVYVRQTGEKVRPYDFVAHRFSERKYTKKFIDARGVPKMEVRRTAADWLQWEHRAVARKLVYAPGQDEITPELELNLWRGWPYEPIKGNIEPWVQLLNFIFRTEPDIRRYFEQWAAYPIQYPGTKMRTAVAVWGVRKGTGKSQIGYTLGDLYGDHFYEISDEQVSGRASFNEWARERSFVMGDEITGNDAREVANRIKYMITREKVEINQKHIAQYTLPDCINYFFTANSPDCFYLEEDDRRLLIHEVKGSPLDDDFYKEYDTWRRSTAGRQALMYHLLYEVDTSDFNPMARPPVTQAKREMLANTRTELESWLVTARDYPDLFCSKVNNSDLVTVNELVIFYEAEGYKKPSPNLVARKMKELGMDTVQPIDHPTDAQVFVGGRLQRFYALRNEEKWRKVTAEKLRKEYERTRGLARKAKF